MKENVTSFFKIIKHRIIIWSSNSSSRYVPKRIENRNSNRYSHTHVHSTITHHNQKLEVPQVSIDGWMDKQNVVYICNRMLFGKWSTDIVNSMDEPWKHKWKKSDTKGYILYNSIYMKCGELTDS